MAARVFVITGAGLTVHHRHGSKRLDPFSFGADTAGHAGFERYLDRFPHGVVRVVVDIVEEEFREETVPHVLGRERRAMLRARADRAFRGARYVHATVLGRMSDGRRDDRVLFSALTRPEALAPWLAAMARRAVPLAGIYSPAMLAGALLKAIGAGSRPVLVVSQQAGGGLRQTCFRRGRLRLSRLAAMPAGGWNGSEVLAEADRTRRYLATLETSPDAAPLEVRVLSHGEPLAELRREAGRALGGQCTVHDLADVARRLGMRRWGGEAAADRLFVHVLHRRPPRNHYATGEETRGFATLRARTFARTASAGLVAGGCLFGGAMVLEGVVASGYARALAMQSTVYEARYREALAGLPPSPAEPAELVRVVTAANTLRARRADPVDLFALIGAALAEFPRVRIERLSWRASADPEAPADGDAAREDAWRAAPAREASAGEASARSPGDLFQIALVGAGIEPFDGDYRVAIDTVRRFAGALAASPGIEHVRVLRLPLDLSSERSLNGDAETTAGTATFEVRVVLRSAVPGVHEVRGPVGEGGGRGPRRPAPPPGGARGATEARADG